MPSPSLSPSGQPSSSWKLSGSSGSFGQPSAAPRMPSLSGSSSTGGGGGSSSTTGAALRPNSLYTESRPSKSLAAPLPSLDGGKSQRTSARRPQPFSTRYLAPMPAYAAASVSL